ncbi:MAG: hypothetical protein WBW04_06755 [Nitrolancea sp.]
MRGQTLCYAHLTQQSNRTIDEADEAESVVSSRLHETLEIRIEELVSRYVADAGLERESLAEEIGALRIVLARLLAEEASASRLATSIPRVVDAVVRAVRAQRSMSGALAEGLTDAVTQVLLELGLGGEQ